jgi:hypothetical protein
MSRRFAPGVQAQVQELQMMMMSRCYAKETADSSSYAMPGMQDDHKRCDEWETEGDCTTVDSEVRAKMIGDAYWPGFCERTCGTCRALEPNVLQLRKELKQPIPLEAVRGFEMQKDELDDLYG